MPSLLSLAKDLTNALPKGAVRRVRQASEGIEKAGVYGVLGKETLGINAPKMIRVRNGNEFIDSSISELGNTAGYFGAGALLTYLTEKMFPRIASKEIYDIGQSMLLCFVPGSILYAMPFIRNYVTAKRTGTSRFKDMVGHTSFIQQPKEEYEQDLKRFRNTAIAVLGIGAAFGFGGWKYCKNLASKGIEKANNGLTKFWKKHLMFDEGKFQGMTNKIGLWFWGLPAYAGWIHASREKEERIEQGVKMLNFFAMFYFLDVGIQKLLQTKKNYGEPLMDFLQKQKAELGVKDLDFSKNNIAEACKKLGFSEEKLQHTLNIRGMHRAIAYTASVVGLFVSNYIASSISIALTAKRAEEDNAKYGKQYVNAFSQIPGGWHSPSMGINRFAGLQGTSSAQQALPTPPPTPQQPSYQ